MFDLNKALMVELSDYDYQVVRGEVFFYIVLGYDLLQYCMMS